MHPTVICIIWQLICICKYFGHGATFVSVLNGELNTWYYSILPSKDILYHKSPLKIKMFSCSENCVIIDMALWRNGSLVDTLVHCATLIETEKPKQFIVRNKLERLLKNYPRSKNNFIICQKIIYGHNDLILSDNFHRCHSFYFETLIYSWLIQIKPVLGYPLHNMQTQSFQTR